MLEQYYFASLRSPINMSNLTNYYLSIKPLEFCGRLEVENHVSDCYQINKYTPYVLGFMWGLPAGLIKNVRLVHNSNGLFCDDETLHAQKLGVSIPWDEAFNAQRNRDLQQTFDFSLLLQQSSGKLLGLPLNVENKLYLQLVYDTTTHSVEPSDDHTVVFGWYGHQVTFDNSERNQNTIHFVHHPVSMMVKHVDNTIRFELDC